jgi:hypothetical protein
LWRRRTLSGPINSQPPSTNCSSSRARNRVHWVSSWSSSQLRLVSLNDALKLTQYRWDCLAAQVDQIFNLNSVDSNKAFLTLKLFHRNRDNKPSKILEISWNKLY